MLLKSLAATLVWALCLAPAQTQQPSAAQTPVAQEQDAGTNVSTAAAQVHVIVNTNNLAAGIERAVEDSSPYYVLGFQPKNLDNKFHRLMIMTPARPELVVHARRGYLAVNRETVRGTNTELAAALLSPIPSTDVVLDATVNVVPCEGKQVAFAGLSFDRNYLTLPAPDAADQ